MDRQASRAAATKGGSTWKADLGALCSDRENLTGMSRVLYVNTPLSQTNGGGRLGIWIWSGKVATIRTVQRGARREQLQRPGFPGPRRSSGSAPVRRGAAPVPAGGRAPRQSGCFVRRDVRVPLLPLLLHQCRCLAGANQRASDAPNKTHLEKPNQPLEKQPEHLVDM